MSSKRPTPKELLEIAEREAREESSGKLKIYLGAAPGVGKTYAMLSDAIQKLKEGADVVAGVVETHGREETDVLLQKIETIPKKTIDYKGHELTEFDIDAILKRNPDIVLVDEMAHSNVPGSRHNKRWQDILELLDRGIDVYTTMNVQHIESLNNIVNQITGFNVRETVPDTVLERAHSIELIDLPPDDLIRRLNEGKVYIPRDIGLAKEHYFRKGNLTALRELALRKTAEQVNTEVLLYRRGELVEKIWPTKERLLVCIGPSANAERLIRSTFRMAKSLNAEWMAVCIATPRLRQSKEYLKIVDSLRLAEQLGGETSIVPGQDMVTEIINIAKERNITKIILGKSYRSFLKRLFIPSLSDELLKSTIGIDLYILKSTPPDDKMTVRFFDLFPVQTTPRRAYWLGFITIIMTTVINYYLEPNVELSTVIMIYFLGVLFVASRGYYWPAFLTSLLSVVAFAFLFVPPRYSLNISNPEYIITLIVMLLVSQVIAQLTYLSREQRDFSRLREHRMMTMHALSRQLASHRGTRNLLHIAAKHIAEVFHCDVIMLMPDQSGRLKVAYGDAKSETFTEKDQSVANWVYDLGQPAGLGTQTLPDNDSLFLPMLGRKGPVGVLSITPKESERLLIPEQIHLLEGFANQTATALEVDKLQEEANVAELEAESERVRNVLLNNISENMRTPLKEIMQDSEKIMTIGDEIKKNSVLELGNQIYNDSEELNHLVNNFAQLVRLEQEKFTLTKKPEFLDNALTAALNSLNRRIGQRNIQIRIPAALPQFSFNKIYIEQVFYNIIENAIKYTPPESPIEITILLEPTKVLVSIIDEGPGVATEELNKIFLTFYRGQTITHIKGMGIGLALCQRIVNLHNGDIWAENRIENGEIRGAIFRFTLPIVL